MSPYRMTLIAVTTLCLILYGCDERSAEGGEKSDESAAATAAQTEEGSKEPEKRAKEPGERYPGPCTANMLGKDGDEVGKMKVTWADDTPVESRLEGEGFEVCTKYVFEDGTLQKSQMDSGCDDEMDGDTTVEFVEDANILVAKTNGKPTSMLINKGSNGMTVASGAAFPLPLIGTDRMKYEAENGLVEKLETTDKEGKKTEAIIDAEYNDRGQLVEVVERSAEDEKIAKTFAFEYDESGNMLHFTVFGGVQGAKKSGKDQENLAKGLEAAEKHVGEEDMLKKFEYSYACWK